MFMWNSQWFCKQRRQYLNLSTAKLIYIVFRYHVQHLKITCRHIFEIVFLQLVFLTILFQASSCIEFDLRCQFYKIKIYLGFNCSFKYKRLYNINKIERRKWDMKNQPLHIISNCRIVEIVILIFHPSIIILTRSIIHLNVIKNNE